MRFSKFSVAKALTQTEISVQLKRLSWLQLVFVAVWYVFRYSSCPFRFSLSGRRVEGGQSCRLSKFDEGFCGFVSWRFVSEALGLSSGSEGAMVRVFGVLGDKAQGLRLRSNLKVVQDALSLHDLQIVFHRIQ